MSIDYSDMAFPKPKKKEKSYKAKETMWTKERTETVLEENKAKKDTKYHAGKREQKMLSMHVAGKRLSDPFVLRRTPCAIWRSSHAE